MERLPRYVADPINGFLDYMEENMQLLHMSMRGIGMITMVPNALSVLGERPYSENRPDDPETRKQDFQKALEAAESAARFAEREGKQGFPLLHAHSLVGAWSALESAIEDAIVGMLMNEPDLLWNETLSKIRIPLAEFEALDKEERMRYLLEELERTHGLRRRQGVDGFEDLLGHVNLSGAVEPDIKKAIWELSNLRNVIVHRGSMADRRLVQGCPWMGLRVGDKVTVTHEALGRYFAALHQYLIVILHRLRAKYGLGPLRRDGAEEYAGKSAGN
jgi:hypothetical protein